MIKLKRNFYLGDVVYTAKKLLGKKLVRIVDDKKIIGRIVEVEAYSGHNDLASHSSNGITKRNEVMFYEGGHLYVYFIYGVHYCINIVTGKKGEGHAILIRAIEPLQGIDLMINNRYKKSKIKNYKIENLCKGPGNVAKAFGINSKFNGENLLSDRIFLVNGRKKKNEKISASQRIDRKSVV